MPEIDPHRFGPLRPEPLQPHDLRNLSAHLEREGDDSLNLQEDTGLFSQSEITELVGRAIRLLHSISEEEIEEYADAIARLRESSEATEAVKSILEAVPSADVSLRWGLLYVLADVGGPAAAALFEQVAIEPVPWRDEWSQTCESPKDGELLVRTMAIEGIARFAKEDDAGIQHLFNVLERQDEVSLRIEAAKALREDHPEHLGRARQMLPRSLQYITDIRMASIDDVTLDPARAGVEENTPLPPRFDRAPRADQPQ